ncbi:hypothetical protein Tco_0789806 [Tanacetum coccineum]
MGIMPIETELALEQSQQGQVDGVSTVLQLSRSQAAYSSPKFKDKSNNIKQNLKTTLNFKDTLPQALINKNFLKERQSRKIQDYLKAKDHDIEFKSKDIKSKITSMSKELQKNSQDHKVPRLEMSQELIGPKLSGSSQGFGLAFGHGNQDYSLAYGSGHGSAHGSALVEDDSLVEEVAPVKAKKASKRASKAKKNDNKETDSRRVTSRNRAKKKASSSSRSESSSFERCLVELVADKWKSIKLASWGKNKEQQDSYIQLKNRELDLQDAARREATEFKREELALQHQTLELPIKKKRDKDTFFYNSRID